MINREQIINRSTTLLEALDIMDKTDRRLLIVCDNVFFVGVISIGDIQRALLGKKDLSLPVTEYIRPDIMVSTVDDDIDSVKEMMRKQRIESMPIIDRDHKLVDVINWDDLFPEGNEEKDDKLNYPVVIMAGGKGTRLRPLTNIIPKPLIPVSDKTIIEDIMNSFKKVGCESFFISVNYKREMIEDYFLKKNEWDIKFVHEDVPLGTAGALGFLKGRIKSTFFVINCDTLVDLKISDVVEYHHANSNDITMVSVVKKMKIPYGTIETDVGGVVKQIREKPEFIYQINSGMYVLEPIAFEYIEENKHINFTELVDRMIADGRKVGAFPVQERAWVDMGNWMEYLKLVEKYSEGND